MNKTAKEAAMRLGELESEFIGRFEKDSMEVVIDKTKLDDMDISILSGAMTKLLMTMRELREIERVKPIESINPIIKKKIVPVPSRIMHIMRYMYKKNDVAFEELFDDVTSRSGIVATFYAVLELLKSGRVELLRDAYQTDGQIILRFVKTRKKDAENG